ncbi:MAG: hypothetical protein O9297_09300 [Flavobacterium sp.]|uniref:hypothetical protein n=1 Tax=Flavobacterium sp. TaxID=239 RepID=UPI0022C28CA5|nr:hypothetical protein [Flavobacterium sp.]MCZ8297397.1 hypothetical protein [Flavobacterium sp.]
MMKLYLSLLFLFCQGTIFSQVINDMNVKIKDSLETRIQLLRTYNYICDKEPIFKQDLVSTKEAFILFIKALMLNRLSSIESNDYTYSIGEDSSKRYWLAYIRNHKVSFTGNGTYLVVDKNNFSVLILENHK